MSCACIKIPYRQYVDLKLAAMNGLELVE